MESIKHSMVELTQHFNSKMEEFQKNLNSSSNTTSPPTNIAVQFNVFRSFMLSALEGLQLQVQLLTKQCDNIEMRSRKKILLLHGVSEDKKEDTEAQVVKVLSEHLKISNFCVDDISRCQRLGRTLSGKSRPILVKFKDQSLRNQIWYSKTRLKGTGVTVSEFLTKTRHETFMAARKRFGVSKCWTKDGFIIVIGPDGKRHSIVLSADLDHIPGASEAQAQGTSTTAKIQTKAKQEIRTRRILKK